jgi:hypothetical protein
MRRALTFAVVLAATGAPSLGAERISVSDTECEVIRILADGSRERSRSAATAAISADGRSARGSSSVHVSGSGSARSSVSVSSSGGSSARATSSYTDGEGRTVTTTRDQRGCTIVVDERH